MSEPLTMTPRTILERLRDTKGTLVEQSTPPHGFLIRSWEGATVCWFPRWAGQRVIDSGFIADTGHVNEVGLRALRESER